MNASSSHDSLLMRLLTECGSCRVMEGGWFDNLLMYSGSSLGFRYGLYLPFDRSSVRSRKFTHLMFVWAVILRPKLSKMVVNSFLALSASLSDVVLRAAKPSSRYKPTSFPKRFSSVFRTTSFPGLQCEDEARHEEALVWAGQFCILIG